MASDPHTPANLRRVAQRLLPLIDFTSLNDNDTGEVIERDRKGGTAWTSFAFPTWWHYDLLRGLEYLRSTGTQPDERLVEAIELLRSKRDRDGRWPLDTRYPGVMPVETDKGQGGPSRWNTLRALSIVTQRKTAAKVTARFI